MLSQGSQRKDSLVNSLVGNKSIQRLCKFASCECLPLLSLWSGTDAASSLGMYATYGARNYNYTKETVEAIRARFDQSGDSSLSLRTPYDNALGVFPCRTFNLGRQSVSTPHTDQNNLAQGWCSITPLGDFNPATGGHLALWNLGLVVQVPPGSTVLIPSSLVVHSNATIQPGETRYSVVQYASGHLFRWVKNGFLTDIAWNQQATDQQLRQREEEKKGRWQAAVLSYTTFQELQQIEELARAQLAKVWLDKAKKLV